MWASAALRCCSFESSTTASVRSSRIRSIRWSLRSAYARTRSGTSTFLPLTIVFTRHLSIAGPRTTKYSPGQEGPRPDGTGAWSERPDAPAAAPSGDPEDHHWQSPLGDADHPGCRSGPVRPGRPAVRRVRVVWISPKGDGRKDASPPASTRSRRSSSRSPLARDRDRRNAHCAGAFEGDRAGRQGRAGRDDVVDQQDPPSGHGRHTRVRPARGTTGPPAVARAPDPRTRKAPATFAARSSRPSSNWAVVARSRSSARTHGNPSSAAATAAIRRRLVVSAPALPLGVDRDRHDQLGALADPPPAARDGQAERPGQPPLAAVLEVVEGGPHRPRERRAPFQLEQRGREVDGHADRRAARQVEPGVEGVRTGRAQRLALTAAARSTLAGSARSSARDAAAETAEPSPRRIAIEPHGDRPAMHRARIAGTGRAGRRRGTSDAGPRLGRLAATTRSPTAVPVRSMVPTGSSRTPYAPRTSGTRPDPCPEPAVDRHDRLGAACPASGRTGRPHRSGSA